MSSDPLQSEISVSFYHPFASDVIFSPEEVNEINKLFLSKTSKLANISSGLDSKVRNTNATPLDPNDQSLKWIFSRINESIVYVNREYFGYELNGLQSLDYLEYNVGQFYGKHVDVFSTAQTNNFRKLSISIQLSESEDYQGGDLLLYCDEPFVVADREIGIGTYFPSYMLHEVTKVTSGVRHCLVGWIAGPKLK